MLNTTLPTCLKLEKWNYLFENPRFLKIYVFSQKEWARRAWCHRRGREVRRCCGFLTRGLIWNLRKKSGKLFFWPILVRQGTYYVHISTMRQVKVLHKTFEMSDKRKGKFEKKNRIKVAVQFIIKSFTSSLNLDYLKAVCVAEKPKLLWWFWLWDRKETRPRRPEGSGWFIR